MSIPESRASALSEAYVEPELCPTSWAHPELDGGDHLWHLENRLKSPYYLSIKLANPYALERSLLFQPNREFLYRKEARVELGHYKVYKLSVVIYRREPNLDASRPPHKLNWSNVKFWLCLCPRPPSPPFTSVTHLCPSPIIYSQLVVVADQKISPENLA